MVTIDENIDTDRIVREASSSDDDDGGGDDGGGGGSSGGTSTSSVDFRNIGGDPAGDTDREPDDDGGDGGDVDTGPGAGGTGIPGAPRDEQPDTTPEPDEPTGPGPGGTGIPGAPRDEQPETSPEPEPDPEPDEPTGPGDGVDLDTGFDGEGGNGESEPEPAAPDEPAAPEEPAMDEVPQEDPQDIINLTSDDPRFRGDVFESPAQQKRFTERFEQQLRQRFDDPSIVLGPGQIDFDRQDGRIRGRLESEALLAIPEVREAVEAERQQAEEDIKTVRRGAIEPFAPQAQVEAEKEAEERLETFLEGAVRPFEPQARIEAEQAAEERVRTAIEGAVRPFVSQMRLEAEAEAPVEDRGEQFGDIVIRDAGDVPIVGPPTERFAELIGAEPFGVSDIPRSVGVETETVERPVAGPGPRRMRQTQRVTGFDVETFDADATLEDALLAAQQEFSEFAADVGRANVEFNPFARTTVDIAEEEFQAGEEAETAIEAAGTQTVELLNLPGLGLTVKEAAEFVPFAAEETVSGRAGVSFDPGPTRTTPLELEDEGLVPDVSDAATEVVEETIEFAEENPAEFAGGAVGSLVGSAFIFGGATAVGSRAGLATRAAIQPGEELAGFGGHAVTRRVAGIRTAERLFPQREPLIFSEEAAIRGARAGAARARDLTGRARARLPSVDVQPRVGAGLVPPRIEIETGADVELDAEIEEALREVERSELRRRTEALEQETLAEQALPSGEREPFVAEPTKGRDVTPRQPGSARRRTRAQGRAQRARLTSGALERRRRAQRPSVEEETAGPSGEVEDLSVEQELQQRRFETTVLEEERLAEATAMQIAQMDALDIDAEIDEMLFSETAVGAEVGTRTPVELLQELESELEREQRPELEMETEAESEFEFERETEAELEAELLEAEAEREAELELEAELEEELEAEVELGDDKGPDEFDETLAGSLGLFDERFEASVATPEEILGSDVDAVGADFDADATDFDSDVAADMADTGRDLDRDLAAVDDDLAEVFDADGP